MAGHPSAQLVRKGYEAPVRGDMGTLRGMTASDTTHHVPGTGVLAGDFKGADEILDMYRQLGTETDGTLAVELRQILVDARGHAVSLHHLTADREGRHLDVDGCTVFRIVGDRMTDLDECVADIDAMNDFWAWTRPKAPPTTRGRVWGGAFGRSV